MEVLELFAPYGPGWLGGVLLALILFYFGRQFLEEFRKQNERKAGLDVKREERKQAEVAGARAAATASARRWRAASPRRWSAATRSWRP